MWVDLVILFQIMVAILIIAFIVTQVVLPLKQGTPLFPIFMSDKRSLSSQLEQADSELENAEVENQIEVKKQQARSRKPPVVR